MNITRSYSFLKETTGSSRYNLALVTAEHVWSTVPGFSLPLSPTAQAAAMTHGGGFHRSWFHRPRGFLTSTVCRLQHTTPRSHHRTRLANSHETLVARAQGEISSGLQIYPLVLG